MFLQKINISEPAEVLLTFVILTHNCHEIYVRNVKIIIHMNNLFCDKIFVTSLYTSLPYIYN